MIDLKLACIAITGLNVGFLIGFFFAFAWMQKMVRESKGVK